MWFALLLVIAAVFGLRGSVRITRRYLAGMRDPDVTWREEWVLRAFVVTSWVITAAACYYGFLSVRSVLGFERIAGIAWVSVFVAMLVLLIPAFLDYVVERVARVPWK